MKTNFLISFLLIFLVSCKDESQLNKIIEQQTLIEQLKLENKTLAAEVDKLNSKLADDIQSSNSLRKNNFENNTVKTKTETTSQKQAIDAIKYHLEMYHSGVNYQNVKAVTKSDGTIDIIVDIPSKVFPENVHKKYYNVSTYSDDTYKINREWGIVL